MLRGFTMTRTGFNPEINVDDCFDYKGETYIIRAIGNIDMGIHRTDGVWISIELVAQKEAVKFGEILSKKPVHNFEWRIKMDRINKENQKINVGDLIMTDRGYCKVLSINSLKYVFVDLVINFSAEPVVELTNEEFKKIVNKNKLNKLGWSVYTNNSMKVGM